MWGPHAITSSLWCDHGPVTPGKGHQWSPPEVNCRHTGSTSFPVVGKRAQFLHLCGGNVTVIVPHGANMYTVSGTWEALSIQELSLHHCELVSLVFCFLPFEPPQPLSPSGQSFLLLLGSPRGPTIWQELLWLCLK